MSRVACIALSMAIACACGATAGSGGARATRHGDGARETRDRATRQDEERTMLANLNKAARAGGVTETLHGLTIDDPFRSLEQESAATRAWLDAQSHRTAEALARFADPRAEQRISELLSIGTLYAVRVAGDKIFYMKRDADRQQAALFVVNGAAAPAMLIDPLARGERAAIDWYYPSPTGRYVACGISTNGDERSTLEVVEVATGHSLPDRISHAKWSTVSWLRSEDAFYYSRYPRQGEPNFDAANEDGYFPRIFFHRLGAPPDTDPLVYGAERPTDFPSASVSEDDRWLVINVFRGWNAADVFLMDRGHGRRARAVAPDGAHALRTVSAGRDVVSNGYVHAGKLYLWTNDGSPRYRIAVADASRAGERGAFRDLVPERATVMESWSLTTDRLLVHYVDDVRSRIMAFGLDGRELGEVALPTRGSIESLAADPLSTRVAISFSSFFHPPTLLSLSAGALATTQVDRVASDIDVSAFDLTQAHVRSADGTLVNVYLVHRRGVARDGHNPVLLTGYGGFNVSLLPSFSRAALYWVERGGVYAVANLRGGGELGEDWHRAGSLRNKVHVFEDFEAVLRWLTSSGWSRPDRIAITGRSNGGLLVGAMITRAPDTFHAAATYVGLYDMVRYHRFPPAEIWISEYGNPEDPDDLRNLFGYSPYHRVRNGVRYPAILIETADHDSRVHWGHSAKFAARLQEATAGDAPIYFYREAQVGHGAGTRLEDTVRQYVRQYAFLEHELAMRR